MLAPIVPRLAIAVVSAVVLIAQITATRLLSATISYHGAFAVLALVMLALAGSASAVYRDRSQRRATAFGPSRGDSRDLGGTNPHRHRARVHRRRRDCLAGRLV